MWVNKEGIPEASRRGRVGSTFTCRAGQHEMEISMLLKLAIHHCLPCTACMRDVWKVSLPYICSYNVHPYWWKRQL